MKYTKIPKTELNVSTICLGTWVIGGDMWGGAKEDESIGAIKAAIDSGINFIDTAPIYGDGISEKVVGKAIAGLREKIVLATKCGIIKKGNKISMDLSPSSILEEIDLSLKRLDTDFIDLYQCHWPDSRTPIEKTMDTLRKIKRQGKIKHIGVSNFDWALLEKADSQDEIITNQVQYSILERSIEGELLGNCEKNNIGIVTYGSLAGGILSGKYKEPKKFDNGDARGFFYRYYEGKAFERTQEILAVMKSIGRPLNQVAINWVRQQKGVTSVIAGCRNKEQVLQNAKAADWELSMQEIDLINQAAK